MLRFSKNSDLYENIAHGFTDFPLEIHETNHNKGFYLYPHLHTEFEILVIKKGDGIMYVDNKEYKLSEGDGIFINSRCIHFGGKRSNIPSSFYAIVFSERMLGSNLNDIVTEKYVSPIINNTKKLPMHLQRSIPWQEEILNIADNIYSFKDLSSWCCELKIKAQLLALWSLLWDNALPSGASSTDKHLSDIKSILEYMDTNYSVKLTLSELAKRCHMSTGHFCRVFSSIMQKSPFEFLMDVRIEKSCHLLSTTSIPISNVAISCGFSDFSYYSKRFKEKAGCTPSDYRKLHQTIAREEH